MRPPKKKSVPKNVKIAAKHVQFKTLDDCHTHSAEHKNYFFRHLGCDKDYHELPQGCLGFDKWVETVATPAYKRTFFSYYEIISKDVRLPAPEYYTRKVVTDPEVQHRLARCFIVQKDWGEVPLPTNPAKRKTFETLFKRVWPKSFDYSTIQRGSTRTMKLLKQSIKTCISYRIWFRKECVVQCSPTIDTKSHDHFLLILQILLAYIEVSSLDT